MSWDVLFQNFPKNVPNPSDIPGDYRPEPIGSREEVIASLRRIFPDLDDDDPSWVIIDRKDFSTEVNMGGKQPCTSFMLHVRGSESAVVAVIQIAEELNLRALDCSTGEFLDNAPDAAKGFRDWRSYRNKVVGDGL